MGAQCAPGSRFNACAAAAERRHRLLDRPREGRRARDQRSRLALARRRRARPRDRDRCRARHLHGVVEAGEHRALAARRGVLPDAEIGAHPGHRAVARLRQWVQDLADLSRLHAAGDDRCLQWRAVQRADAGLVGAQHGCQPAAHAVGRGGAERIARNAQRHPHRASALLHPAGQLGADRGARRTRLSHRLSGRERHL